MSESLESVITVVGSHTTVANTTEGKVVIGSMVKGVVNSDTATGHFLQNCFHILVVGTKQVHRQGLFSIINKVDDINVIFDADDGEDGSKDLVLHNLAVATDFGQNGGFDPFIGFVVFTSNSDFAAVQISYKTVDVSLGDDSAEIGRLLGIISVPLLQHLLGLLHERILHRFVAQDVVWSDAGLTQVEHLSPKDTADSNVHVSGGVNVARTFASQF